jgi:hypothetical protein
MRADRSFKRILIYVLTISLAISCKEEVPPTVITSEVTVISGTTAKSGGLIYSEGSSAVTERGVCWSTNPEPTINDENSIDGEGTGNYTSNILDLDAATTYYLRAYATNSSGVGYGISRTFRTLGSAPSVITQQVTALTGTTATLTAMVNSNYFPTTVTFEYGNTTSYGNSVVSSNSPLTGASIVRTTAEITGLLPNHTYHFRVKSENDEGIVYSNDVTFITMGGAPYVFTTGTSGASASIVVLNGMVNPNYLPTEVTFECGTTTSYELPALTLPDSIDGSTGKMVSITMTGLTANTTYHYRIKAVNSLGTTYGNDVTFTTDGSDFPTDGLVAYYKFTGGTAQDLSGFGNHAVISGPVATTDRFSEPNESFQFNAENDILLVNNPGFLNNSSGSIAVWVKFDNLNRTQYVASVGDISSNINYFGLLRLDGSSNRISLYYRDPDPLKKDWINGSTVLAANVYYQLVLTSDGSMWNLYINGVKETLQIVEGRNSGKWFSSLPGLNNFVMGNSLLLKPYVSPYLTGKIDELILYNRKLSEAEIVGLYYYSSKK